MRQHLDSIDLSPQPNSRFGEQAATIARWAAVRNVSASRKGEAAVWAMGDRGKWLGS